MNTFFSSNCQRTQELNLKQFEIRKTAKLCICFVCFIQIIFRLSAIIWDKSFPSKSVLTAEISLLFCIMMIAVISLENFLFKKKGASIVKYSSIVDLTLLMIFVGDWVFFLLSNLYQIEESNPSSFQASAFYGFTSFSWRALLITLLVEKWQLKIIALITATFVVTGYAVNHCQEDLMLLICRAVAQLFKIILIVYCQDKVKWKLMRTNLEQEKWMQMNDFILDSIPEKIMILDLSGEAKFMSEYCRKYLKKFNLSVNIKEFFKSVKDIQQLQQYDFDPASVSTTPRKNSMTACSDIYDDEADFLKVETLQDLITRFPKLMRSKNLKERQFLVYNGKFRTKTHHIEKSMEMRVSFVHQYENDFIILIFRDTTQRDRLIALEVTDKYKDHLLASISHELRAPLNGNINLVEAAIDSPETPENVKVSLLIPALRSGKVLLHIINDILDMSQIKQKKLRLVFQPEDLKETLKNTAQLVDFQARKKGLDFSLEVDRQVPENFCTDHHRVGQIVLNLLTNAMKFTNKGKVKLIASYLPRTSSVKVSVQDTGVGIHRENINKLFTREALLEIEDRDRMNPHGVGLGLNVASNLVRLLAPEDHKNIDVISIPNRGSTFTFILEDKHLQEKEATSLDRLDCTEEMIFVTQPKIFDKINTLGDLHTENTKSYSRIEENICLCPKVLIVDDNPFNTMALETILRSLQIRCDSVYSGACALEKLHSRRTNPCCENCKPYSVIFMDQEMPGMSGADTTREIKKLQEENKLSTEMRIIGCTAHKVKEEVDRFLASGLESCIFKPVSIGIIKDTLKDI